MDTNTTQHRLITLRRTGRRHELLPSQITAENLRRMFQVDAAEVWLRDDVTDQGFCPEPDGSFMLPQFDGHTVLHVEGPESAPATLRPGDPSPRRLHPGLPTYQPAHRHPSLTTSSTSSPASVGHSAPVVRSNSKKTPPFLLKITKAKLIRTAGKKKPEFKDKVVSHFDITESTASLSYILSCIKGKWGEDYMLVTSDGVELEESNATQSLQFWKCPSRRMFAVKAKYYNKDTQPLTVSSSDDSDDDLIFINSARPSSKRRKHDENDDQRKANQLILKEISSLKATVNEIVSLQKNTRIPLGVLKTMKDTFQCTICHVVPVNPPVIVTKCCKTVLGCSGCVNTWYSGTDALTKSCPVCRAERGYNETMLLHGLDDFLNKKKVLMEIPNDTENQA